MATRARVELTPTYNDEAIANLMYRALASSGGRARFGDRKVFIAPLWDRMVELDADGKVVRDASLADFKTWLVRSRVLTRDGMSDGPPLVVLARADFVSAMDPDVVARSETTYDVAQYHFVLDPAVARKEYAGARRSGYEENPSARKAWVTRSITNAWRTIERNVDPNWLPKLDNLQAVDEVHVRATLKEYGCGTYGCVYPTSDPMVVMKLTTDDTEAEFAGTIAESLVMPICVHYYTVIATSQYHGSRRVYLLWRESAEKVGKIAETLGFDAETLINTQWDTAQAALKLLIAEGLTDNARAAIAAWLEACEGIARQTHTPELRALGEGLVEVFARQRIFFGDIHSGNVGIVSRPEGGRWVITDPGNIVILSDY